MSQNVHISSLTAPERIGPTDFQHLSQRKKAVLMHSLLPRYANAYNKECYAKSVANFSMLSQESFWVKIPCHSIFHYQPSRRYKHFNIHTQLQLKILQYICFNHTILYTCYQERVMQFVSVRKFSASTVHCPKFFASFQYLARKWIYEKQVRSLNVTDVPNCLHFSLKTVVGYLKTKIKLDALPSFFL
jgi:hypothetical protein